MAKINVKINETNSEISKRILTALAEALDDAFLKAIPDINKGIRSILQAALYNSPEYLSLKEDRGDLRLEFGIDDRTKVDEIVNIWLDSVQVKYKNFKATSSKLVGGILIVAIPSDYNSVLSSSFSQQQTKKGQSLPWLQWLLLEGGKIIIDNYQVRFGPSSSSRTGYAVMRKSKGNGWSIINSQFRGTYGNNWITRAIDKISEDVMVDILKTNIEKHI